MKLNRYYIPSRGWAFISILGIFLGIFVIYETLLNFFMWELPFFSSAGETVFSICFFAFELLISIAYFCCAIIFVALFCRPVKFTQVGIERGVFLKERVLWSEVTTICWAPVLTTTTKEPRPATALCVIVGDFSKERLSILGTMETCLLIFLEKHFPRLCEKDREKNHIESYGCPEKCIWLKTNENVERDILKKWKEVKSQQTPVLDEQEGD